MSANLPASILARLLTLVRQRGDDYSLLLNRFAMEAWRKGGPTQATSTIVGVLGVGFGVGKCQKVAFTYRMPFCH